MNGNAEEDAPRPRPLSAGIWTLFSWLRRSDRSSSSESVTSVGSDRTVASFDFLGPLNYKSVNTPLVLPQAPLTDTYKKRLQERNLRRQYDRDLTLRRKYGLFREEGLGYDAFTLPSARRLQKDIDNRQARDRRATSESIQRRTPYVPGKRRAPLPPAVVISATLPRHYKRKRPAPKPPVKLSEENKENLEIDKILQMNSSTSDVGQRSLLNSNMSIENKSEKHSNNGTKEVKLRTEKSFLKQIFDNKKRNSAIDTSHIKLLPSISELDKQAAEIIEANKSLRASEGNNSNLIRKSLNSDSYTEETWICTTCLRKYKPVVKCCIYCIIKENSNKNKIVKKISTNASQTDGNILESNRKNVIEDRKMLKKMLKEMKDSLPKKHKHSDKGREENNDVVRMVTETPTLRIGSSIDEGTVVNFSKRNTEQESYKKNSREIFLLSQPSSSKQIPLNTVTNNVPLTNPISQTESASTYLNPSGNLINNSCLNMPTAKVAVRSVKVFEDRSENQKQEKKTEKKLMNVNDPEGSKINKDLNLGNVNNLESYTDKHLINSGSIQYVENKENAVNIDKKCTKDIFTPLLANNTSSAKESKPTEKNSVIINICEISPPLTMQKSEGAELGIETKIDRIQLGSVFSTQQVRIGEAANNVTSNQLKNIDLRTPLKISSLLNPLYCPKNNITKDKVTDCSFANILTTEGPKLENNKKENLLLNETPCNVMVLTPSIINRQTPSTSSTEFQKSSTPSTEFQKTEACLSEIFKPTASKNSPKLIVNEHLKSINVIETLENNPRPCPNIIDHHGRRRDLINQLEQAISKGDEQAAAEAAAKLAKLKLSCSVLSFSSQIVADASPNKTLLNDNNIQNAKNSSKLPNPYSSSNIIKTDPIDADPSINKTIVMKDTVPKTTSYMVKADSSVVELPEINKLNVTNNYEDPEPMTSRNPTKHKELNISPEVPNTTSSQIANDEMITIDVWVEDKEATRGPMPLPISRKAKMGELKRQAETSLGIEIRLQRWIIGRTLCTDDNTSLVTLAGRDLNAPFYLCLVESETSKDNSQQIKGDTYALNKTVPSEINNVSTGDVYTELMKLEQQALVSNTDQFECGVCIEKCAVGAGAILRECLHSFCKECLADVIRHCEEPVVTCPAIGCPGALQEREIRSLLSTEEHERWLARSLATAESGTRNTFHCRTRDCKGWAFCEPGVRRFPCPVCKHTNCVPCQAVHKGESCERYQAKLREAVLAAETNQTDEGTQALLKSLISRGEALECPECSTIITKKWGCDWVKCSACKTEICWITKGRRWGPGGKGDTSGGCRCGIDGKRCHPSCGYCH